MNIIGYENYKIYPDGRVWSNGSKWTKPMYLSPASDTRYLFVSLSKNGVSKNKTIHRLVAEHYIENPYNKPCVDHINRIKTDNRVENLRWVSYKENSRNYGCFKTNISGHRNISWDKPRNKWFVNVRGQKVKRFDNKIDAICYKYIRLLIYYANDH